MACRGVEVQPYDIGRFGGKLFVGADAPRALPLQADPFLAQHPPHRMHRTVEGGRHCRAVPGRLTRRRRLFQQGQHPVAKVLAINRLGARPRRIAQPGQTALSKTLPPLDDGVGASVALRATSFTRCPPSSPRSSGSFHKSVRIRSDSRPTVPVRTGLPDHNLLRAHSLPCPPLYNYIVCHCN